MSRLNNLNSLKKNFDYFVTTQKRYPNEIPGREENLTFNLSMMKTKDFNKQYKKDIYPIIAKFIKEEEEEKSDTDEVSSEEEVEEVVILEADNSNIAMTNTSADVIKDKINVGTIQSSVDIDEGIQADSINITPKEKYSQDTILEIGKRIKTMRNMPFSVKTILKGIVANTKLNSPIVDSSSPGNIDYIGTENGETRTYTLNMNELNNAIKSVIPQGTIRGFVKGIFYIPFFRDLWDKDIERLSALPTLKHTDNSLNFPGSYLKKYSTENMSELILYQLVDCVPEEFRSASLNTHLLSVMPSFPQR